MGRTKPSAQPAATSPDSHDRVSETEVPVILNWTAQGVERQQELTYFEALEKANEFITRRLSGHFVSEEDMAWARRVGEKERERVEAEEAWNGGRVARPQRKTKAGKRLTAAELTFLDPNVEDSNSSLTEVSDVSALRPSGRTSPDVSAHAAAPAAAPAPGVLGELEENGAAAQDHNPNPNPGQQNEDSAASHDSRQTGARKEISLDDFDWDAEAAMWEGGGEDESVRQDGQREDDNVAEEGG